MRSAAELSILIPHGARGSSRKKGEDAERLPRGPGALEHPMVSQRTPVGRVLAPKVDRAGGTWPLWEAPEMAPG